MKKNLVILTILSLFLYSCGNGFGGFDPRAYNKKSGIGTDIPGGDNDFDDEGGEDDFDDENGSTPPPDLPPPTPPPTPPPGGGEGEWESVLTEYDPFEDETYNPDGNGFNSDTINNWDFKITHLDSEKVPHYKFNEGSRTWTVGDTSKKEYSHDGATIGESVEKINSVKYYKYAGKNPMFDPTNPYNTEEHGEDIARFNFYRFSGIAGILTFTENLNNYVIAVDSYTKLVYAYAVPTKLKDPPLSGYPKIPQAWGSVEGNVKGPDDKSHRFYEYDPIGIVASDGNVEMYTWFYNILASEQYGPTIDLSIYEMEEQKDRTVATAGKPGRSPYISYWYYEYIWVPGEGGDNDGETPPPPKDEFLEAVKLAKFEYRNTNGTDVGASLTLNSYNFSYSGLVVIHTKTLFGESPQKVADYRVYTNLTDTSGKYGNDIFELREVTNLYINSVYVGTSGFEAKPLFSDIARNSTFSYRDTRGLVIGDSLTLDTYKFSDNGKEITYSTKTHLNKKPATTDTLGGFTQLDDGNGQYNGATYKIEGNNLFKNNAIVGVKDYDDSGPLFPDRVAGATFKGEKSTEFKFSNDGKTFKFNNRKFNGLIGENYQGKGNYTFIKNHKSNQSIYELEEHVVFIQAGGWYGLELYDNDQKIKRTSGTANGDNVLLIPSDIISWEQYGTRQ